MYYMTKCEVMCYGTISNSCNSFFGCKMNRSLTPALCHNSLMCIHMDGRREEGLARSMMSIILASICLQ